MEAQNPSLGLGWVWGITYLHPAVLAHCALESRLLALLARPEQSLSRAELASGSLSSDGQLRWAVLCCCPSVAHGSRTILGHLASLCAPTSSPGPCAFPLPEQAVSLVSASQCPSPQRRLGRGWRPLHRTRTPPRHRHTSLQPLDPVVSSGDLRPSDGGEAAPIKSQTGCHIRAVL